MIQPPTGDCVPRPRKRDYPSREAGGQRNRMVDRPDELRTKHPGSRARSERSDAKCDEDVCSNPPTHHSRLPNDLRLTRRGHSRRPPHHP